MAIRWREDRGVLICAAMSEPNENDVYFDDHQHYHLSINEIIIADDNHKENGLWHWNLTSKQIITEEPFDAVQAIKDVRNARTDKLLRMLDEE